ncbi:Txe/YoeB family addiction module toxin [Geminicoccus harenae]|uniref:Txe/YoeB family addiction module toxin n=1 Tax=Geminicoccus harenae TaxID=2498453 RepID=UPI00168B7EB6|nr:Txe/YoeB family addiction module toxin [Geminicoccus harenae]
MKLVWAAHAWEDYLYWQSTDRKILKRLNRLIEDTMRNPFGGIGDPEPLKNEWQGFWSKRIDGEHRLVYRMTGKGPTQALEIAQCRFHYGR